MERDSWRSFVCLLQQASSWVNELDENSHGCWSTLHIVQKDGCTAPLHHVFFACCFRACLHQEAWLTLAGQECIHTFYHRVVLLKSGASAIIIHPFCRCPKVNK